MTFPAVPRDTSVELWLNNQWVDVKTLGHVRAADGIHITRGRPNEAGQVQPSTCSLTLDNRTGNYSPRNPLSPYYGVLGRNTPIRVSVNLIRDTFTRTSVNDWDFTDTGQEWFQAWSSGGSLNDFDVAGGVGTHTYPTVGSQRQSYIPSQLYRDIDVAVTVTFPYADITGANMRAGIMLRSQTTDDNYYAALVVTPLEEMYLQLWHNISGTLTSLTTEVFLDTFTYSAQPIRIRAQVSGLTLSVKAWPAASVEPYEWHNVAPYTDIWSPGWVGLRSDVFAGSTNTLPAVISFDSFIVRSVRFAGEVSAWPQRWDTSGVNVTAPIEAAGILRRLSQGNAPQLSTIYRSIVGLSTPAVAYWPCEEGSESTSLSSAVGGPPMVVTGNTDFAAYNGFVASQPIPTFGTGSWNGPVPQYTSTGALQLRFLMHVPDSGFPDSTWMVGFQATGGQSWDVKCWLDGSLSFDLWVNTILIFTTGAIGFAVNGKDLRVTVTLEQNGSAIDWELATLEEGTQDGGVFNGTTSGRTLGRAQRVLINPHALMSGTSFGHVSVRKEISNFWDETEELNGFAGEFTVDRIARLCFQNSIDVDYIFDPVIFPARVGPQRPLSLLTLLQEAVNADLGTLVDSRTSSRLISRERPSLYSQSVTATLDYAGGQVAPPFQPIDDDQQTRNDIAVNRVNGGYAHAVLEEGRLSIKPPEEGGVGTYDTSIDLNVYHDDQLPDIAGFELGKGTVDETRYPVVRVGLHFPEVVADSTLSAALLDLDVDDRFQIINPMAGQTPDTIDQIALGYTESIYPFEHFIAINAAPASPYEAYVLDETESRLDTSGSDLTALISTSAASFQVDVPDGTLWPTTGGDLPMSITVGGEEITVGAVSGASSPQTFSSVTRSVNGIVKSHPAGTPISIARPRRLGL